MAHHRVWTALSGKEIRLLEHAKTEAERDMFVLQGAIQLLAKQQEDSIALRCCAVCTKPFDCDENAYLTCLRILKASKLSIEQKRLDNSTAMFNRCLAMLQGQTTKQSSQSRLQFYIRSGVLAEWREQKIASLKSMHCSTCLRAFDNQEFASFLRRVDYYSSRMERDLHMHSDFHPLIGNIRNNVESPPCSPRSGCE